MIMNKNFSPEALQHLIGYTFKNPENLKDALTRGAYLNEHPSKKEKLMDPLATVGDAILDAVVVCKLYEEGNRKKGTLTIEKSKKVKRERTRDIAERHQLQEYILWGEGEKKNKVWKAGNKVLDTVFEALVGAVFLDAQENRKNGIKSVRKILDKLIYFD